MASDKIPVIEFLWDLLQNEGAGRRVVNQSDVTRAITACIAKDGIKRSVDNPANFLKDIVRGDNASENWPQRLTDIRITARQRPGNKRVFEFEAFAEGQTEPFPNKYTARPELTRIPIEAVSLSLAKRSLGRRDESWLIQVAVELRIVQTHFATRSKLPIEELSHLQTGVKLGNSEIDCLFLAHLRSDQGAYRRFLVTCEAKQEGQRVLEHQIVEQIVASARSVRRAGIEIDGVIPIALKAVPEGCIYFAEFSAWTVEATTHPEEELAELELASEAVYQLRPPVPGIGVRKTLLRIPKAAAIKKPTG